MRKLLLGLIFSLFVTSTFASTNDLKGWNGATWGMSEQDLLVKFKDLKRHELNNSFYFKAHSNYELDKIKMFNLPFKSYFYFDDKSNKLDLVILTPKFPSKITDFENIIKLATKQYGKVDKIDKKDVVTLGDSYMTYKWFFNDSVIEISYYKDIIPNLIIIYRQKMDENSLTNS